MSGSHDRDHTLDEIRTTYGRYVRDGRSKLWTASNPGFRRLAEERDRALVELIRRTWTLPAAGLILDVGCGSGGIATLVESHQLPLRVTGIDLLPERIEAARERA